MLRFFWDERTTTSDRAVSDFPFVYEKFSDTLYSNYAKNYLLNTIQRKTRKNNVIYKYIHDCVFVQNEVQEAENKNTPAIRIFSTCVAKTYFLFMSCFIIFIVRKQIVKYVVNIFAKKNTFCFYRLVHPFCNLKVYLSLSGKTLLKTFFN